MPDFAASFTPAAPQRFPGDRDLPPSVRGGRPAGAGPAWGGGPVAAGDGAAAEASFEDMLDVVNPLHHVPVVGTIYRAATGDTLSGPGRVLGGLLFGGPIGFAIGLIDAILTEASGDSLEQHTLAGLGLGEDAADPAAELAAGQPEGAGRPAAPTSDTGGDTAGPQTLAAGRMLMPDDTANPLPAAPVPAAAPVAAQSAEAASPSPAGRPVAATPPTPALPDNPVVDLDALARSRAARAPASVPAPGGGTLHPFAALANPALMAQIMAQQPDVQATAATPSVPPTPPAPAPPAPAPPAPDAFAAAMAANLDKYAALSGR